ncbi:MAG: hypothetical protein U0Q16_11940 [Bryobacteraceae bacterium]
MDSSEAMLTLWAYDGWNNAHDVVASEIQNPQRNLPLALVLDSGGDLAFLGTNIAYFSLLSAGEVAGSPRVAARPWGACSPGWLVG